MLSNQHAMPCAMYPDPLKYFMKIVGNETIRHILRVVTIFLDIRLCLFTHKFFLR